MMKGLLDAFGNPVGAGPSFKMSQLLDSTRKIFEGPVTVKYYSDRLAAKGTCFHCLSKIEYEIHLTKAQVKAVERDQQFKKNLFDLMCDKIQDQHQCLLLDEGKDRLSDLYRDLHKERMQA